MIDVPLTQRTYLGKGYFHRFRNTKTGELVHVECTEEEYTRMQGKGGSQYNPTLAGHVWECSMGGTIMVDTPEKILGLNEYTIVDNEAFVLLDAKEVKDMVRKVDPSEIVGGKISVDERKLRTLPAIDGGRV